MAISPIGGMVYANQNMQAPATQQADFQQRLDAQTNAAMVATNEQKKEIEEVRPTEETYELDPEKDQEEKKKNKEKSEKDEQELPEENEEKKSIQEEEDHLLDIKI